MCGSGLTATAGLALVGEERKKERRMEGKEESFGGVERTKERAVALLAAAWALLSNTDDICESCLYVKCVYVRKRKKKGRKREAGSLVVVEQHPAFCCVAAFHPPMCHLPKAIDSAECEWVLFVCSAALLLSLLYQSQRGKKEQRKLQTRGWVSSSVAGFTDYMCVFIVCALCV